MTISTQSSSKFSPVEKRAVFSIASLYGFRMLGLFMVLPVMSIYFDQYQQASAFLLGLALGIYGLTQAILQIPLGLLSDKIGRRPVILGGLLVFILGSVVAATAETAIGVVIGRALQGTGAIASTLMALVTDLTAEQNRTKAMASIGGSIGISFAVAMVLGPVVAANFGLAGIFWLTAALGLIGAVIVFKAIPKTFLMRQNRETQTDLQQLGNLLREPSLMRLNMGIFFLHLTLMAAFVVIPNILVRQLAINPDQLWWFYLSLLGGGFIAMLPAMIFAEKRNAQKNIFVLAVALMTIAMLVLGSTDGVVLTVSMLFIYFAAFNLLEALLPSWLSKVCPVGNRGTAMGIYSSCQFLGTFTGGILGGFALANVGIDGLFWLLGLMLLFWCFVAATMASPKPLQTLILQVGETKASDFVKSISNIVGVEDILLIEGEDLAYVKVNKNLIDLESIQPFLNRT
ncbi:MAG: Inner membrane transport protein YajR [Cellvibrionales bacterium UBA7375]|nr:MAG: Inner membrane transport protein YajR [Cellvibrionales bacterium UBA7375]